MHLTPPLPALPEQVGWEEHPAGTITLVDFRSSRSFVLKEVSAEIWKLACQGHSLKSIVDTLEVEFEVERQQLLADVTEFLDFCSQEGLLKPSSTESLQNGL